MTAVIPASWTRPTATTGLAQAAGVAAEIAVVTPCSSAAARRSHGGFGGSGGAGPGGRFFGGPGEGGTFAGDASDLNGGGGAGLGGAIFAVAGELKIVDSTVAGNESTGAGTGITVYKPTVRGGRRARRDRVTLLKNPTSSGRFGAR